MPRQAYQTATSLPLFYPTAQKNDVLKTLARFGILTVKDLSELVFGNTLKASLASIVRTTRILEAHGYANRIYFRPEAYDGRGVLPFACGLSEKGVAWAKEHYPASYAKAFLRTQSPHTIEHDIKCARTDIAIANLGERYGWSIGSRKDDLYHLVKPDRLFEITAKGKTKRFLLEEENKKKCFQELFAKLEPYVNYRGSSEFKNAWGFAYYYVLVPMRDADAAQNAIIHFAGNCNCIDSTMRGKHTRAPFLLQSDHLLFTSHDRIVNNAEGDILRTPTGKLLSLPDIMGCA